jgi:sugar/nucleoside kinase (ribokinase family)
MKSFRSSKRCPSLGEECFARRFQREVGGGAAITTCGLAKPGVQVSVLGVVGRPDGDWVVSWLKSFGVDRSALEYHPTEPTGITASVSTREDRAFFSFYGANRPLGSLLDRSDAVARLARFRCVHFACAPDADRRV